MKTENYSWRKPKQNWTTWMTDQRFFDIAEKRENLDSGKMKQVINQRTTFVNRRSLRPIEKVMDNDR